MHIHNKLAVWNSLIGFCSFAFCFKLCIGVVTVEIRYTLHCVNFIIFMTFTLVNKYVNVLGQLCVCELGGGRGQTVISSRFSMAANS